MAPNGAAVAGPVALLSAGPSDMGGGKRRSAAEGIGDVEPGLPTFSSPEFYTGTLLRGSDQLTAYFLTRHRRKRIGRACSERPREVRVEWTEFSGPTQLGRVGPTSLSPQLRLRGSSGLDEAAPRTAPKIPDEPNLFVALHRLSEILRRRCPWP